MNNTANPLLIQPHFLDFASIKTEHIAPAVDSLLQECQKALEKAVAHDTPDTWESVIDPLDDATERFSRAWGAVGHLMSVMDTPELRAVYNEKLPAVSEFFIRLSQDARLFAKLKAIEANPQFQSLDRLKQRLLRRNIRDFRLSGAELPDEKKQRMLELGQQSSELHQKFSENLLDATNAFHLDITDRSELDGIPEDTIALYAQTAKAANVEGYRITLHYPSYLPALKYANSAALRKTLFEAYLKRASELDNIERDNTPLINQILKNRAEEAALLGFETFADLSLATKMAQSPAEVLEFLRNLGQRARPYAERDRKELTEFAREELGMAELNAWDRSYVSEKLRIARYAYSDQEVKQYFTLPTVFKGLFALVERLYGIHIRPSKASVWHPDVEFFEITDGAGRTVAHFYTDLFARPSKRGGAWMDSNLTRGVAKDGSEITPIAYLVCNFSQPVNGKPALLTHDDVTTLFHEFGHGLHHMLSQIRLSGLSGINGVEWDAVEMPSQFMENWCWQYEIIQNLTSHIDTGEVLPRELFDKMLAAKNFQSGLFCVRQLEFALFDMLIHTQYEQFGRDFMQTLQSVRNEVSVWPTLDYDRFPQSFAHIFAGGYSAGYYSYKWAEVLSADAFAAFEEEGLFNPDTGRRWLKEVLEVGSSRDAIDSFVAFRGRKPSLEALLRHTGMSAPLN